jgi:hypothetical protein
MPGPRSQEGRLLALQQEREALARNRQLGIRGYDRPGFTDQFTAPINDELAWLAGYGSQGVGNIARNLTGRPVEVSALDRARAMREISNEGQDQFVEDYPVQAFTGGVLGGIAMAPARGAVIPGLIGRLGTEAGLGAAYGAAEGDSLSDRLAGAGMGAGIGVALGAAAELAAPYVGRMVNRVRNRGASQALDLPALTGQTEAEAALARYRAAYPEATNARVLSPGDEGYPTNALYDEVSQTYVAPDNTQILDASYLSDIIPVAQREAQGLSGLVRNAIGMDVNGVRPGFLRELDRDIQQGLYSAQDIANSFPQTRQLIRDRYGDTVTLYRANPVDPEALAGETPLTVYMGDKAFVDRFAQNGRVVQPYDVNVDDILALNSPYEGYNEFIVNYDALRAAQPQSGLPLGGADASLGSMVPTNALGSEASQAYVAPVANALTDYDAAAPEVMSNALSSGTGRKGALNDAFASASNYDEALELARQGVHLRQGPDGQYVGAPRDIAGTGSLQVDSPEKLEEMRGLYDDYMRTGGGYGADWYDRARQSLTDISDSPEMASFASRASSAYSPQATPDTEWNNFINQHNAKMVRGEDFKPMTGRQMENVASGYSGIGQNSGQYTFVPENVRLGNKTGPYSDAKDPGIDRTGTFRSANDLWHGRATGYSQSDGGNFDRAFTDAEHGFLTGENILATQRARDAGILPPDAGVEAMQAAVWVEARKRAYVAEQTARFNAGLRPDVPTAEEVQRYAGTGIVEAIDRSRGALTREFTPGGGLGELENVGRDPAMNAQFSDAMNRAGDPKNEVFTALQMYQNPTTPTSGFWNDPAEGLQINPAFTDLPLVGTMPETITLPSGKEVRGGPAMSPFGRQAMQVAGRLHGYENMQHGVGANMFIPRNSSHKAQQLNGLRVTGGDPATIAEAARLMGLDAVDTGDAVLLTSFTPPEFGGQTNKQIQQSGKMLADQLGLNVSPGRFDANYVESGLSSDFGGQITPQGQGIATQQLLDETAQIPQFDQRMDATNYAQNVAARNLIRRETAAAGGGALRPDAERARDLLAQGGVGALREYVKRFGLEGLPAWVGPLLVGGGAITLPQGDQDQQQAR